MLSKITFVAFFLVISNAFAEEHGGEHTAGSAPEPKILELEIHPEPKKELVTRAEPPSLQAPQFFTEISGKAVTLSWVAVEGADFYHVQLATDPNFKWLVLNEPMFNKTEIIFNDLEPAKHYYWRVASLKSQNDPGYVKGNFHASMFRTK